MAKIEIRDFYASPVLIYFKNGAFRFNGWKFSVI